MYKIKLYSFYLLSLCVLSHLVLSDQEAYPYFIRFLLELLSHYYLFIFLLILNTTNTTQKLKWAKKCTNH